MNHCNQFSRMQELQANAQLFGNALRNWQTHVQNCGACAAQAAAERELQKVLGSEAVPNVPRSFASAVLRRAHVEETAASRPKLSPRRRLALVLNWAVVLLVCSSLAAMIQPASGALRNPAIVLPMLFLVGSALVAALLPQRLSNSVSGQRQQG